MAVCSGVFKAEVAAWPFLIIHIYPFTPDFAAKKERGKKELDGIHQMELFLVDLLKEHDDCARISNTE